MRKGYITVHLCKYKGGSIMGIYIKTLEEIKKLVHKGKYKLAKKKLDNHIHEEHHFHSDLHHLQRATRLTT